MSECVECGANENVVDHHVDYEKDDTVPVCRPCHWQIHQKEDHPLYPEQEWVEMYPEQHRQITEGPNLTSALAAIAASEDRRSVVRHLIQGASPPKEVSDSIGLRRNRVGKALRDLREVGAVELLVPEETKKGRVYALTDHGRDVAEQVGLDAAGEGDGD